jgi:hypothetical protein
MACFINTGKPVTWVVKILSIRTNFALSILMLCFSFAFAARDSTNAKGTYKKPDYFIDDEQYRIDTIDGVADGKINLGDSASSAYARAVYIDLIDSIQRLINRPEFDDARRRIYRETVYFHLHKVRGYNVYLVKRYDVIFRFIEGELNGILQGNLLPLLESNMNQAFKTFAMFKSEPTTDTFLIFAAKFRPDVVLKYHDFYKGKPYALHVLEETSKIAPVTVKRYFNLGDPIYEALKTSNDTIIKVILKIKDGYTRKSNAFTLIDGIMDGSYSLDKADEIGNDPKKFLHAMLKIRAKKNPLGEHSLEDDLATYSLKFVRVLNDMHNEKDDKRFASIEKFSAEELYTLMVYSEEEIFTSTFNGLFNRLMVKLGPVSGSEFLDEVGNNRFRTFIKMCAGFGKLDGFLQSMTALHKQMLMIKFASDVEKYNDLSQAVEVADAFASINDSLVLKILRGTIKYEYIRLKSANNVRGQAIYGLLLSLFVDRNIGNANWYTSISKQYEIPPFDHISNARLFNHDSVSRWVIYFYDDEDGESSFTTFIQSFTDNNWKITDSSLYVIIKSKTGLPVQIYANKWKNEYDGQAALEKIFNENDYEPNVMVHRGHSYYAYKTIDKIKDNTQIFVLGSCGGYHSISTIIERSPEISIISSKQIGTKFVNNPMLKLMAEYVRQGKDIQWQQLWDELGTKVKNNPLAYDRYLDYIPPHKNLGAIFIKTYNKMTGQD